MNINSDPAAPFDHHNLIAQSDQGIYKSFGNSVSAYLPMLSYIQ